MKKLKAIPSIPFIAAIHKRPVKAFLPNRWRRPFDPVRDADPHDEFRKYCIQEGRRSMRRECLKLTSAARDYHREAIKEWLALDQLRKAIKGTKL